jgi:hypothetical protein
MVSLARTVIPCVPLYGPNQASLVQVALYPSAFAYVDVSLHRRSTGAWTPEPVSPGQRHRVVGDSRHAVSNACPRV